MKHLVFLESKKSIKDYMGSAQKTGIGLKALPLDKEGIIWASKWMVTGVNWFTSVMLAVLMYDDTKQQQL